jgi:phosphoribosylaminoimidazole-succinocarboxamide synthase
MTQPLYHSQLDLKLINRGKVRDVYELDNAHLLIVTSDRLSAFDVVLPTPIRGKGAVLTKLTRFWMNHLQVKNHLARDFSEERVRTLVEASGVNFDQIEVVRKAKVFPVECVVRGYITGSGWKDYQRTGEICGHKLPTGLLQCAQLPEPLFTPSTKATEGHDENISFDAAAKLIGKDATAKLRDLSINTYLKGSEHARERGILIADTKFEFGVIDGEICIVDEVLTPDSSRFWPADKYEPGHDQSSFDKQIVRNYLLEIGWNKTPPGPELPVEIAEKTAKAYQEILERLTEGKSKIQNPKSE